MRAGCVIGAILLAVIVSSGAAGSAGELGGAWTAVQYHLADGNTHRVAGTIFFTERNWQVLFFVLDGDGQPQRGSAEGGTYTLDGEELVLWHQHNLSIGNELAGLPASPLRMTARAPEEAQSEPTRIEIEGGRLTLHFPSGNRMSFVRAS